MTKRQAKREACHAVGLLISNYFDVGQPFTECAEKNHPNDDSCKLCEQLATAFKDLQHEMERRTGSGVYRFY